MADHTPTPWVVDPDDRIGMEWNTHITLAHDPNHRVCFMTSGPEGPINADFIVKAANNHEALVEMVRELVTILDNAQSGFISGCGSDIAWHKGRESRIADARLLLDAVGGARE